QDGGREVGGFDIVFSTVHQSRRGSANRSFHGGLQEIHEPLRVVRGDHPAKLFCFTGVRTVKVFDRVNDRVLDFGGDVVTDGDQVVGTHKALTGIREFTVGDAAADGSPVMPIHHDDRRFTPQLQSDGGQLPSGALIHPASNG